MKYYIQTGLTARDTHIISKITTNKLPNLDNCNIDTTWVDYCLHTMDCLAVDFNFYMFFQKTFPNVPQRLFFTFLNSAVLELTKLLDARKNSEISLQKVLNRIEQNINNKTTHKSFILFKKDIENWLNTRESFIYNLFVIRDKMIAHQDVSITQLDILNIAMNKFNINEFIDVANATIEILCNIIKSIENCDIMTSGYFDFDEFNFIYEALRSLDKIEKHVYLKNQIIHNIDLELREIKKLIE